MLGVVASSGRGVRRLWATRSTRGLAARSGGGPRRPAAGSGPMRVALARLLPGLAHLGLVRGPLWRGASLVPASPTRDSTAVMRLLEVADQSEHVFWEEATDRAAGVNAHDHASIAVEDETGGLEVERLRVDERARRCGDGAGIGTVPDRKGKSVLRDQRLSGGFVIDRYRNDPDACVDEIIRSPLKCAQLRVAVGAPRPPVEQHYREVPVDVCRQVEGARRGWPHCQRRKAGAGFEDTHYPSPGVVYDPRIGGCLNRLQRSGVSVLRGPVFGGARG